MNRRRGGAGGSRGGWRFDGATLRTLARRWTPFALAALGVGAVAGGAFTQGPGLAALLVALPVVAAGALDVRRRVAGQPHHRPMGDHEGPILWAVTLAALVQLGGPYRGDLLPLLAGYLAWVVATFPQAVALSVGGAVACIELGLALTGHQTGVALVLHAVLLGAAGFAAQALVRTEAFRRRLGEAHARTAKDAEAQARAHDFGLLTEQTPALRGLPRLEEFVDRPTVGQQTLDFIAESFRLQLEFLRTTLDLGTAAVLWRRPGAETFTLRGYATAGHALAEGPFPVGQGVPGSVLRDGRPLAMSPVSPGFRGLPYHLEGGAVPVGALLAVPIPAPDEGDSSAGVLCVDRADARPFSDTERRAVELAARKLALDVGTGQRLKSAEHDRTTIGRFCAGLQCLNGALGLDQVGAAACESVRALVRADVVVLSVVKGEVLHVVHASGEYADRFQDLRFTADEGLVGKAVRLGQTLPVNGAYRGNQPVFTAGDQLTEMRSLLVVPLIEQERDADGLETSVVVGALTMAAREAHVFSSPRKEMLELIGAQVAVKLDLARAHEQIRELATTDGLTGLNNHRVFQQTFDAMLQRARRRGSPVCLLLTDIDKFKNLNDTYGHPFGDEVLKGVARVLAGAVRSVDLAARYGGEEFAVLLEDAGLDGGRLMAERIRAEVEALSFAHPKGPVRVTLSLGVTAFPGDGDAKTVLIERADAALYQAKHGGRNQFKIWAELPIVAPGESRADPARAAAPAVAAAKVAPARLAPALTPALTPARLAPEPTPPGVPAPRAPAPRSAGPNGGIAPEVRPAPLPGDPTRRLEPGPR